MRLASFPQSPQPAARADAARKCGGEEGGGKEAGGKPCLLLTLNDFLPTPCYTVLLGDAVVVVGVLDDRRGCHALSWLEIFPRFH